MSPQIDKRVDYKRAAERLAEEIDRFYRDLAYAAPEQIGERLNVFGATITPTMELLGYPRS